MYFEKPWSFYNPTHIIFGPGSIKKLTSIVPSGPGLIITSPGFVRRGLVEELHEIFEAGKVEIASNVEPNPDIEDVEASWKKYRGRGFEFVIGIGGGSVLDTAKALSYLLKVKDNDFSLRDHLINKKALPNILPLMMIAVPTTAGTGSEVTPFSTIWDLHERNKYSLALDSLNPTVALLDPELTLTLPKDITIITGLDALSHSLESIWNINANPVSLSYAARAIEIVLNTLPALIEEPHNLKFRAKMLTGSLFGGLCISSTRTALAHSMSYPITSTLGVPHGLACSFTLPALFQLNMEKDDGRFGEVAQMVGLTSNEELGQMIDKLFEIISINRLLAGYNLKKEDLLELVPKMFTPERAGNNYRPFEVEDVKRILASASAYL